MTTPTVLSPRAIVLIDDDPSDLVLTSHLLEKVAGPYPIIEFTEPERAFEWLSRCGAECGEPLPLVIFTDLKMPRINGFDVIRWIRGSTGLTTVPVIAMSSSGLPEDIEGARDAGASDYLVKFPTSDMFGRILKAAACPTSDEPRTNSGMGNSSAGG